jgi:DNA modification methylase
MRLRKRRSGMSKSKQSIQPQPSGFVGRWQTNQVHNVDAFRGLREVPDDVIDVAITSPPYWGQRGSDGIGSEADPRDYIRNVSDILAEALRCLKPTGTLWLNIGDSYNTPINWSRKDYTYSTLGKERKGFPETNKAFAKNWGKRRAFIDKQSGWLQYGNLLSIPNRIVLELCNRGFLYRGEVIWLKAHPLPEGICRRPHRQHEGIYILAKSERHSFRVKPPVPSIWRLVQTNNTTAHCSPFPVDLPVQCIRAAGLDGRGLVFDPFMGSGTTAKAARLLGHDFLGFELNPAYCALANETAASMPDEKVADSESAPGGIRSESLPFS